LTLYLDSSAILKLIVKEAESAALSKYIKSSVITSAISRVEVIRTLSRNNQALVTPAAQVLAKFEFLPVSQAVLSIAESFVQSSLRSLDAIQVASVIFLSPKNNTLITYDKNMAKEARLLGIKVESLVNSQKLLLLILRNAKLLTPPGRLELRSRCSA